MQLVSGGTVLPFRCVFAGRFTCPHSSLLRLLSTSLVPNHPVPATPPPPLPPPLLLPLSLLLPAVDLEEEFRLLTLQIIGEAILSLPPEECDRVFPSLYLPVMEESNVRVLAPWRQLYPLTAYRYNSRVKQVGGGHVRCSVVGERQGMGGRASGLRLPGR